MYSRRGKTENEHCTCMQVLEVLRRASQAVKVTWKTDELDKENKDPMPAAGTQKVPAQAAYGNFLLARLSWLLTACS